MAKRTAAQALQDDYDKALKNQKKLSLVVARLTIRRDQAQQSLEGAELAQQEFADEIRRIEEAMTALEGSGKPGLEEG